MTLIVCGIHQFTFRNEKKTDKRVTTYCSYRHVNGGQEQLALQTVNEINIQTATVTADK